MSKKSVGTEFNSLWIVERLGIKVLLRHNIFEHWSRGGHGA